MGKMDGYYEGYDYTVVQRDFANGMISVSALIFFVISVIEFIVIMYLIFW